MSIAAKGKRFIFNVVFVCALIFLFKSFIVGQLTKRAQGYLGFNMYKDAVREYRKALMLTPDNSEVMNWLGYAYKGTGDMKSAIDVYKGAIEVDPQNIIAYHGLGMIYAGKKNFRLAKEYFLKASSVPYELVEERGEDFYFHHKASLDMLSICQEKLDEIEAAIETNRKILEYYPDDKLAGERIKRLSQ